MMNKKWREVDSPINKNYRDEILTQNRRLKSLLKPKPTHRRLNTYSNPISSENFPQYGSMDTSMIV